MEPRRDSWCRCAAPGKRRSKFILSRRLYGFLGEKGTYTRKRGLDRETNKQLLLKHIRDNAEVGTPLAELMQVLPGHTRGQLKSLVTELKDEGLAHPVGGRRWAKWFPKGKDSDELEP